MNKMQKEILDFAVAQLEEDSTPGIALCCDVHKKQTWNMLALFSADVMEIPGELEAVKEEICLN